LAAALPALVALALFPGWWPSIEVFGSFLALDQLASQFIEPFVVGRGVGVSPVALLISAMYWSWLWGIPGLLLATPITACLKVVGDHLPAAGFLSILLGADRKLKTHDDFYRMLLEQDANGARDLAFQFCDKHGLERTFDEILVPVMVQAGNDASVGHIGQETQEYVTEKIRELIEDLGARNEGP